jgi:hypothetical protein
MDGTAFGYHDGLVILRPDQETTQIVTQIESVQPLYVHLCLVCHESRDDFSMPCPHCGDIE